MSSLFYIGSCILALLVIIEVKSARYLAWEYSAPSWTVAGLAFIALICFWMARFL